MEAVIDLLVVAIEFGGVCWLVHYPLKELHKIVMNKQDKDIDSGGSADER